MWCVLIPPTNQKARLIMVNYFKIINIVLLYVVPWHGLAKPKFHFQINMIKAEAAAIQYLSSNMAANAHVTFISTNKITNHFYVICNGIS